jgi:dipeptidyl aminopeptidase/acylaminoacyl peptidase
VTRSPTPLPGPAIEPSLHRISAEDGLEVPYWEYAPSSGTPRGTILSVHGGPEAQARPYFYSGIHSFLVSEGWRVIEPNVRGSTGYGRTYVHLDDVRRRMDSVRDLRDLVRALASEGKAPPGRVGVFGGSYGGFMVLAAITTYPELFSAAAEFFGIANFVTFLERTGPWRRKVREDEYGSLEHDREYLATISPIHHVDRIVAPLLVAHGDNDVRVPLEETEQIVAALKRRGVPVEFLRYANEGHGFSRLENQLDSYGRTVEFFDRYLPPP